MRTFTRYFTSLLTALVLALAALPSADASGPFETRKMIRPQGPSGTLWLELETMDYPGGPGQNEYISCVPGTSQATDTIPSDVVVTLWFYLDAQSGRYAKSNDKKDFTVWWMHPFTNNWEVLDFQTGSEERRKPKDLRYRNVARISLPPSRIPYGTILFKVGNPHNQSPPDMVVQKVKWTYRQKKEIERGARTSTVPAFVMDQYNRGLNGGNGDHHQNGDHRHSNGNGTLVPGTVPNGVEDFDPNAGDDGDFTTPNNGHGNGARQEKEVEVIVNARQFPRLKWVVNGTPEQGLIPLTAQSNNMRRSFPTETQVAVAIAQRDNPNWVMEAQFVDKYGNVLRKKQVGDRWVVHPSDASRLALTRFIFSSK